MHLPSTILGYIELFWRFHPSTDKMPVSLFYFSQLDYDKLVSNAGYIVYSIFSFNRLHGSRLIRTETPIDALDAGARFELAIFSSWSWRDNQTSLPCYIHYTTFSSICQEVYKNFYIQQQSFFAGSLTFIAKIHREIAPNKVLFFIDLSQTLCLQGWRPCEDWTARLSYCRCCWIICWPRFSVARLTKTTIT